LFEDINIAPIQFGKGLDHFICMISEKQTVNKLEGIHLKANIVCLK